MLSLRRKKNLTQEQLAKLTGVKQSSIVYNLGKNGHPFWN
ncbi:MAG: helix-turn-helix transcriptional regulator [Actinobacteria bacterium]|nr:helix-turn-helix transcriptional regulator [Actinomycetota bacterium]